MRRLSRGLVLAVLVGGIATMVSIAPALFIQSVFIGSAQRCEDRQRFEEAAFDQVTTTCGEDLGETPYWFPVLVIAVGGAVGTVGGFFYGYFTGLRPPGRPAPPLLATPPTGRDTGGDRPS